MTFCFKVIFCLWHYWIIIFTLNLKNIVIQFCLTFSRYPHTDFTGHRGSHDHAPGASGDSQWPRLSALPMAPETRAELSESNAVQLHEGPCLVLFVGEIKGCLRSLQRSTRSLLTLHFSSYYAHSSSFLSYLTVFNLSLDAEEEGRAGAGQGAHPANRREDPDQIQGKGGGDATALFVAGEVCCQFMRVIEQFGEFHPKTTGVSIQSCGFNLCAKLQYHIKHLQTGTVPSNESKRT